LSGLDLYPWFKALHVAAALIFVGGVLATAKMRAAFRDPGPVSSDTRRAAEAARRWSRYATTPAMLAVWALGLGLATEAGWFMTGWLRLKLVFVVALSGLHGLQSGALRRLAAGTGGPAPLSENAAPIVVALALVIATLAVVKPF